MNHQNYSPKEMKTLSDKHLPQMPQMQSAAHAPSSPISGDVAEGNWTEFVLPTFAAHVENSLLFRAAALYKCTNVNICVTQSQQRIVSLCQADCLSMFTFTPTWA